MTRSISFLLVDLLTVLSVWGWGWVEKLYFDISTVGLLVDGSGVCAEQTSCAAGEAERITKSDLSFLGLFCVFVKLTNFVRAFYTI